MVPSYRNVIRANPLLATYQTLFVVYFIGLGGLLALLILRIAIGVILGLLFGSMTLLLGICMFALSLSKLSGGNSPLARRLLARLIVRLRCRSCGQDGIAILDFGTNTITAEPITVDDVLDTHDLLARTDRPPADLFPALIA